MKTYGVRDLTERYGVGDHTVLAWIRSGELRAINVARTVGTRPKWRVLESEIESFELRRSSTPQLPIQKRGKKTTTNGDIIKFYK